MDVVTHALLGAQAGYAVLPARSLLTVRQRLAVGAIAAAFPDIDFVGFRLIHYASSPTGIRGRPIHWC
jgi:inner membrane protein